MGTESDFDGNLQSGRLEHEASGMFVVEAFDYDGGRLVTAYVPTKTPEAIVYAGDGQSIAMWGPVLKDSEVPSTMIVGVHGALDEWQRLHEYSPGFEPERFAAHEKFFAETVPEWVKNRFGVSFAAERTAVLGVSAGGELALALGLRRPDFYGVILCASPGAGYQPPEVMPSPIPRAYLLAGREEPFFLANALRWAEAFRAAGVDFVMRERVGEHGGPFWKDEFPLMVEWGFE